MKRITRDAASSVEQFNSNMEKSAQLLKTRQNSRHADSLFSLWESHTAQECLSPRQIPTPLPAQGSQVWIWRGHRSQPVD